MYSSWSASTIHVGVVIARNCAAEKCGCVFHMFM
jgi:hypothetical protein